MNGIALTPEAQAVAVRALNVPEQAKALRITDTVTYAKAGDVLTAIKELREQINAAFDPIIKKAHETHKEVIAQKKKAEAPLVEAEGIVKPQIAAYQAEQERRRREEEERIRQELMKAEEEARMQAALAAEAAGNQDEAEQIIDEPIHVAPVVLPKTTPKLEGISTRKVWKFRITDESKIPREYLAVDVVKIGGVVRALGNQARIPGIEVYQDSIVAVGGRK